MIALERVLAINLFFIRYREALYTPSTPKFLFLRRRLSSEFESACIAKLFKFSCFGAADADSNSEGLLAEFSNFGVDGVYTKNANVLLSSRSMLKSRSVQVALALLIYLTFASRLPLEVHQSLYTISLFIKDLLLWMLPITVSLFIAYAIASFEKRAPLFILAIFLFEGVSNALSVWYSFGCGHLAAFCLPPIASEKLNDAFDCLWRLPWTRPSWWAADKGSLLGMTLGLLATWKVLPLQRWIKTGKTIAENILTRFFARLIPLFVLGFVARMHQTHLLSQMFSQYAEFLLWLAFSLTTYIAWLFFAGSAGSFPIFLRSFKNLLPAAGIAFSSGCSLSTMPWTIRGTAKNLQNPALAQAVIPATTNIQQIGDCIANAFLCFLIYLHFYGSPPTLAMWASFSLVFVLARFATAAIIGGAIFIMLPIYETYLHFTPEMIAIILAFNVILDPLITASNVIANGALCRIFERFWSYFTKPVPTNLSPSIPKQREGSRI